jgi:hypothetical protein
MKSDSSAQTGARPAIVVGLVVLGLILYVGLLSRLYDGNGIIEAIKIEEGGGELISPNRILYRPLVWLFFRAWQALGYTGPSLFPAQILTAVSGAAGLGLFYGWVRRWVRRDSIAIIASVGMGTSWAYWSFSTDVYYIMPATALSLAMLIALSAALGAEAPSLKALAAAGLFCALSILFVQTNVFLVPVVLVGLFMRYRHDGRQPLSLTAVFAGSAAGVVGGSYLFVGAGLLGHQSLSSLLNWIMNYGGAPGARLPVYGTWETGRLVSAAKTWIASLIPVWEGLGLRALLTSGFEPDKIWAQASLVGVAGLFLTTALILAWERNWRPYRLGLIGWLLLGFMVYVPFIVWWEPYEPMWFIIPNISVWTILALAWDPSLDRRQQWLTGGLVLAMASANFATSIWPRHAGPNVALQAAECVAGHMGPEDLLSVAELRGRWLYVGYFYDRSVFNFVDVAVQAGDKASTLEQFHHTLATTYQHNGRVYIESIEDFSEARLNWLTSQTGLTADDFQQFERQPAFTCAETRFQEIKQVR